MTSKLPKAGRVVFCTDTMRLHFNARIDFEMCPKCTDVTEQLAERDRAIAREVWTTAWLASESASAAFEAKEVKRVYPERICDDYLASDEFLSLIGEMKHGA